MPSHPVSITVQQECSCGVVNCLVPPCEPQPPCTCGGPVFGGLGPPIGEDGRPIAGRWTQGPLGPPIRIDETINPDVQAGLFDDLVLDPVEAGLFDDVLDVVTSEEAGKKLLLFQQALLGLFLVGLFTNTFQMASASKNE